MVNSKGQSLGIQQPQFRLPSLMPATHPPQKLIPSLSRPHLNSAELCLPLCKSIHMYLSLPQPPHCHSQDRGSISVFLSQGQKDTHPIREAISFFPEIHNAGPATTGGLIIIARRFEVESAALCEGRGELEY